MKSYDHISYLVKLEHHLKNVPRSAYSYAWDKNHITFKSQIGGHHAHFNQI